MATTAFNGNLNSTAHARFANADGTTAKQILGSSLVEQFCDHIYASNNDTIAHVVRVYHTSGGTNYLLGSVSLPAATGTLGNPGVDLLAASNVTNGAGIRLGAGDTLSASMEVAVVATFAVDIVASAVA